MNVQEIGQVMSLRKLQQNNLIHANIYKQKKVVLNLKNLLCNYPFPFFISLIEYSLKNSSVFYTYDLRTFDMYYI